jgi:hypothetical protein
MIEGLYRRAGRQYRRRRFALLQELLTHVPKPFRILDVGGRPQFYTDSGLQLDPRISVTLLNISTYSALPLGFESVLGDGRDLSRYGNGSFDVVHSNSVLAYVGGSEDRARMAAEIQRVGRRFFVQSPNLKFPLDWRTAMPFFHFLRPEMRAWLLVRTRVGRQPRFASLDQAKQWIGEVEDVEYSEFRRLFPTAQLIREKFLGLTKSFVAYQGFAPAQILSSEIRDRNPGIS